jgi:hypothetical protein
VNVPTDHACCPFLRCFTPEGRAHVYQLCQAVSEEPLYPSAAELAALCRGRFTTCPRYRAAMNRLEAPPTHELPHAA